MMGFSGWGTAGVFVMMVGILVVVSVTAAAAVLLIRPVFDGGKRSSAGTSDRNAASDIQPRGGDLGK